MLNSGAVGIDLGYVDADRLRDALRTAGRANLRAGAISTKLHDVVTLERSLCGVVARIAVRAQADTA